MGETVHTYPVADCVVHSLDEDCICGPGVEYLEDGKHVLHHSLDGREHSEPDHDRESCPGCP